jgi:hypothetical protein
MNKRRLSYGLLVTLAAAGLWMVGCDTPPPPAPPPPSATPADSATPAPTQTAAAEPPPAPTQTAAPEPPPPPPKPAKDKFVGKFVQAFEGDVKDAADAAAKKAAGKADKDGKKYNAAMEKAQKAFTDMGSMVENTDKQITWSLKGKTAHTLSYEGGGTDPNALTIKLGKDGKTDMKGKEVAITFKDDNTFEMVDPFAKKDPKKLVFKRQ